MLSADYLQMMVVRARFRWSHFALHGTRPIERGQQPLRARRLYCVCMRVDQGRKWGSSQPISCRALQSYRIGPHTRRASCLLLTVTTTVIICSLLSAATSKRTLCDDCASGVREMRKRLSCLQFSILSKYYYCKKREVKHSTARSLRISPPGKKTYCGTCGRNAHTRP